MACATEHKAAFDHMQKTTILSLFFDFIFLIDIDQQLIGSICNSEKKPNTE